MKFSDVVSLCEDLAFNPANPESTPLFHGSDSEVLDKYDLSKARTAAHIYTTVDPEGAQAYGKYLYRATPRSGLRYLDLSPYGDINYRELQRLYQEMAIAEDWGWTPEEFEEIITGGRVYDVDFKGRFQDELMNTVEHMGYDALVWVDSAPGNRYMDTVVFFHPNAVDFERVQ